MMGQHMTVNPLIRHLAKPAFRPLPSNSTT